MNSQKKSGKFQLRLTEALKEEVVKLSGTITYQRVSDYLPMPR